MEGDVISSTLGSWPPQTKTCPIEFQQIEFSQAHLSHATCIRFTEFPPRTAMCPTLPAGNRAGNPTGIKHTPPRATTSAESRPASSSPPTNSRKRTAADSLSFRFCFSLLGVFRSFGCHFSFSILSYWYFWPVSEDEFVGKFNTNYTTNCVQKFNTAPNDAPDQRFIVVSPATGAV